MGILFIFKTGKITFPLFILPSSISLHKWRETLCILTICLNVLLSRNIYIENITSRLFHCSIEFLTYLITADYL